jgi:hypothetical protein
MAWPERRLYANQRRQSATEIGVALARRGRRYFTDRRAINAIRTFSEPRPAGVDQPRDPIARVGGV